MKRFALLLLLISTYVALPAKEVDIFVFSYDRPMQLYAFLESLYYHASHIHETSVMYRCSNQAYRNAYAKVFDAFPQARAIEQKAPPHDFKPILMYEVFRPASSEYIAFAVDDMIVTGSIDFRECIEALEATNAYGFYLRLGQNIDDCFSSGHFEAPPSLTKVGDQIFSWQFKTGVGDWAYPNTVDMTIYRKADIEPHFQQASFWNPNLLEDRFGVVNLELTGLCHETSRVVNIPLNIVSDTTATQHLGISAKNLLDLFNVGWKIDIAPFAHYRNRSAHVYTCEPSFVLRFGPPSQNLSQ